MSHESRRALLLDAAPHPAGGGYLVVGMAMGIVPLGLAIALGSLDPMALFTLAGPGMVLAILGADHHASRWRPGRARRLELLPVDDGWRVRLDGRPAPAISAIERTEWHWHRRLESGVNVDYERASVVVWAGGHAWARADLDVADARHTCDEIRTRTGIEPAVTVHQHAPTWLVALVWCALGCIGMVVVALFATPPWAAPVWGLLVPWLGYPLSRRFWRFHHLGGRTPLGDDPLPAAIERDFDRVSLECRRGNGLTSVTIWVSVMVAGFVLAVIQLTLAGGLAASAIVVLGWLGVRWLSRPLPVSLDAHALVLGRRRMLWDDLESVEVTADRIRWQHRDGRRGDSGPLAVPAQHVETLGALSEQLIDQPRGPTRTGARMQVEALLRRKES